MSRFDAAALIANTALEVRNSGQDIIVRHAAIQGQKGILIFIPGFELKNGNLHLAEREPPTESVEAIKTPINQKTIERNGEQILD